MKVLVTGAGGQVGRELLRSAPAGVTARGVTRAQLDIADAAAVRAVFDDFAPDAVINAAAYTAVDKAEQEPAEARRINVDGVRVLAGAVRGRAGCRLVHISTDYVFDGASPRAYAPDAPTAPLGVYGSTKLDGELAAREALAERATIVRTAWVYGVFGKNFLHTMLRLMRERGSVKVVADQIGTPTSTPALAALLWAAATRQELHGVLHWTDAGVASWYDFAVAIGEDAAALGMLPAGVQVSPISTAEFPTPARRPACSLLDKQATVQASGLVPLHWRQRLREILLELRGET